MRFRPCIDLHGGKVKQIVGSTLESGGLTENYVSEWGADRYAALFSGDGLSGGHVIMLGGGCAEAAESALSAWRGGLQIGGGINRGNAESWLAAGASAVIVTSAVFRGGGLDSTALAELSAVTGVDRLVLDLSCAPCGNGYRVAAGRWAELTSLEVTPSLLAELEKYCFEYLVHAVSSEGKRQGPDLRLAALLAEYARGGKNGVVYAGGIASEADIARLGEAADGSLDFTVGSALDIYGGSISYRQLAARYNS